MRFEWDPDKARRVFEARGIDFRDVVDIFAGDHLSIRSDRGEPRWLAIGVRNDRLFAVVYTRRGDAIRIITARRARTDEERAYRQRFAGPSGSRSD